jgi:hypothetical protein
MFVVWDNKSSTKMTEMRMHKNEINIFAVKQKDSSKNQSNTFDLRRPPKVCCMKVVSCNLGSTLSSPPSFSKHMDCIDAIRSLDEEHS